MATANLPYGDSDFEGRTISPKRSWSSTPARSAPRPSVKRPSFASRSSLPRTPGNACAKKVDDYLQLGVPHIWAFAPSTRHAYLGDANGF